MRQSELVASRGGIEALSIPDLALPRLLVVALLGEHPDEGTQHMADALNQQPGVVAIVANEEAAKTDQR